MITTTETPFAGLVFSNSYAQLPPHFYHVQPPTSVAKPSLIKLNTVLAQQLGLDAEALGSEQGLQVLAGNCVPPGAACIALAYAGHQFGYFNPQLGDGRALLLGEVVDGNGKHWDIQLKGSGPTPYSRNGDGRSAMGPVVREYVVSEAMHALGINTTRALAAVSSGESVYRDGAIPGAVFTRVASSHIRVGTFEFLRAHGKRQSLRLLADYVIDRHYPQVKKSDDPYLVLLQVVIDAQIDLVASWMQLGFIHGVMNTDNTSISGETIDYGPCAFMEAYNPNTVFSSIDREGRYAYGNQASIALWNLSRFAESLLPLLDENNSKAVVKAEGALESFFHKFEACWLEKMARKVGLHQIQERDASLIQSLLDLMQAGEADFTLTFRRLSQCIESDDPALLGLFNGNSSAVQAWLNEWRQRLVQEGSDPATIEMKMNSANPLYIPRNHRIESVIGAAVNQGDYAPMEEMLQVLLAPFTEQQGMSRYADPAPVDSAPYKTFCGT